MPLEHQTPVSQKRMTQSRVEPVINTAKSGTGKHRRWWHWGRDLLLLLIVVGAVQWWQSRGLVAGKAPVLVGLLVDGQPYQLDYRAGPMLVHFWATWCPVCKLEQDNIDAVADSYPVITIATTSGSADEVAAYLSEQELSMPVLMDEGGDIARQWGLAGVPATFIVGREGEILYAGMGYATEYGLRARMWWAGL